MGACVGVPVVGNPVGNALGALVGASVGTLHCVQTVEKSAQQSPCASQT